MATPINNLTAWIKSILMDYSKIAVERQERRYIHKETVASITDLKAIPLPQAGEIRSVNYTVNESLAAYDFVFIPWKGNVYADITVKIAVVYVADDLSGIWWLLNSGNLDFKPLVAGASANNWFPWRATTSGTSANSVAFSWGKFYLIRYAPGGTFNGDTYTMVDNEIIPTAELTDNFQMKPLPYYKFNYHTKFNRFQYTGTNGQLTYNNYSSLTSTGTASFSDAIYVNRRVSDSRPARLILRNEVNGYGMIMYREDANKVSYLKNYNDRFRIISNGLMQLTFNNDGDPIVPGHVLSTIDDQGTLRWVPPGTIADGTEMGGSHKWIDAPDDAYRSSRYTCHYGSCYFHIDTNLSELQHVAMVAVETEIYSYNRTYSARWYSTTYNYTDTGAHSEVHAPIFDTRNQSTDPTVQGMLLEPEWFGYIADNGYPTKVLTYKPDTPLYMSYIDTFWRMRFMGNTSGPFSISKTGMWNNGIKAAWDTDAKRDCEIHNGARNTLIAVTDWSNTHENANPLYNDPVQMFKNNGYGVYFYPDSSLKYKIEFLTGPFKFYTLGWIWSSNTPRTFNGLQIQASTDNVTWTTVVDEATWSTEDDIDLGGIEAKYLNLKYSGGAVNLLQRHISFYAEPV